MSYAAKTQNCTISHNYHCLRHFLTQKLLSVPKSIPWYVLGAVSEPREFMRAKSQNKRLRTSAISQTYLEPSPKHGSACLT